jgi:hypothetical protein
VVIFGERNIYFMHKEGSKHANLRKGEGMGKCLSLLFVSCMVFFFLEIVASYKLILT